MSKEQAWFKLAECGFEISTAPQVLKRDRVVDLATTFARKLIESDLIPVKEVYLYGSYAYGTPDEWSDIDIAVITDKEFEFEELIDLEARVRRLAREIDIRIEPVIFTSTDRLGFMESEVKKGIRIYPEVKNGQV